jgi:hypothetical protein
MSSWKLDAALSQGELDLLNANRADGDLIDQARHRIEQRRLLLKVMRRRNRRHGLVNVSYDTLHPYWVRKEDLPK